MKFGFYNLQNKLKKLILDESLDISFKSQLSVILRYFDGSIIVKRFIKFINVTNNFRVERLLEKSWKNI